MAAPKDTSATIRFKFRHLDKKGRPAGYFASRGNFDGEFLILGSHRIPADAITRAQHRYGKVALTVTKNDGTFVNVVFQMLGPNKEKLLAAVNTIASVYQSQKTLASLQARGRPNAFHTTQCPYCKCLVDLTGFPDTPQFYCLYCDTIVTRNATVPEAARFRLCDKCQRFSQPQQFTAFYFYFLGVVHGYFYQQRCMCAACMRAEVWKLLLGNLLFLVGVPNALIQLCRAYSGDLAASPAYRGLDRANAVSRTKNTDLACKLYEQIEVHPEASAGVFFNHGNLLIERGQSETAIGPFESALSKCANYPYAAVVLLNLYRDLDRMSELTDLSAIWSEKLRKSLPHTGCSAPAPPEWKS